MKRPGRFAIAMLFALLWHTSAPDGWAASRGVQGVRVTTDKGKELYLYKDYQALVIGVGNYDSWPKLPNAVNDAREVSEKLTAMGFQVKTVIDPASVELKKAFTQLIYQTGSVRDRAILLYFAGHGETETLADGTKLGYIVPRDCPLIKKEPMRFSACAISMRDIESFSLKIKSRHVIMLFDSCFSGSLFSVVRAVPDDVTEKAALPVRQYITAGKENEQVPDRSMFKRVFLTGLEGDADLTKDGYVTGSEMGMYLSEKVVNYTRRAQHPQYGKINNPSLDRGDFIFVPVKSPADGKAQVTAGKASTPSKTVEPHRAAGTRAPASRAEASPVKPSDASRKVGTQQAHPVPTASPPEKAASSREAAAAYEAGMIYYQERNYPEAFKKLLFAAEQGHAAAQQRVADMYRDGRGIAKSDSEALKWYRRAAAQGSAYAPYWIGVYYRDGRGTSKDSAEAARSFGAALRSLRKESEKGDPPADYLLGMMHRDGSGVKKSDAEAVKWFRKAADRNHAWAQYFLGVMHREGRGVEKSDAEAVKWFRKSAEQGNDAAQYSLGSMLAAGLGCPKNEPEAIQWYRSAATQGHAGAQQALRARGLSW